MINAEKDSISKMIKILRAFTSESILKLTADEQNDLMSAVIFSDETSLKSHLISLMPDTDKSDWFLSVAILAELIPEVCMAHLVPKIIATETGQIIESHVSCLLNWHEIPYQGGPYDLVDKDSVVCAVESTVTSLLKHPESKVSLQFISKWNADFDLASQLDQNELGNHVTRLFKDIVEDENYSELQIAKKNHSLQLLAPLSANHLSEKSKIEKLQKIFNFILDYSSDDDDQSRALIADSLFHQKEEEIDKILEEKLTTCSIISWLELTNQLVGIEPSFVGLVQANLQNELDRMLKIDAEEFTKLENELLRANDNYKNLIGNRILAFLQEENKPVWWIVEKIFHSYPHVLKQLNSVESILGMD